jgi:hypothetical protein
MGTVLCMPQCIAQSVDHEPNTNNLSNAVIPAALAKMGAQNLDKFKEMQVDVLIERPDKEAIPSSWREGWGDESAFYRREFMTARGEITSKNDHFSRETKNRSGELKIANPSYDLVELSRSLPVAALALAVTRRDCVFHPSSGTRDTYLSAIDLTCIAPSYRNHYVNLTWFFDKDGIPSRVILPIVATDGHIIAHESIRFLQFQETQGITIPKVEEVSIGGTQIQNLTFSNPILQTSFSKSDFSVK